MAASLKTTASASPKRPPPKGSAAPKSSPSASPKPKAKPKPKTKPKPSKVHTSIIYIFITYIITAQIG